MSKQRYEYKGKLYSLYELAEVAPVSYSTLYRRICSEGMTVEQAINHKSGRRPPTKLVYKGRNTTYTELAKEAGMPRNILYARVHQSGMTLESALAKPYKPKDNEVIGDAPKCCAPDCDNCPFSDCVI